MRMRLHVDSTIGDSYIYPIYDIDFDKLKVLSGYSVTIAPTDSQGHKICKWSVSNQTGIISRGLPATVPRKPEQEGNILPERFVYTDDVGGVLYLEHFTDPTCWQKLDAQPMDWSTGTDYVKIWTNGAYRHVWAHAAGNNDAYDANNTYKDLKKMTMRVFFTDQGGHFSVYKTGVYNGPGTYYPCQWGVGCVPSINTTSASEAIYRFTSDNGQFFPSNFLIRRSTTALTAGATINAVYVYVHFYIDGVEYYGIAEIFYNNFSDNPVPTGLSVVGIDKTYWSENVIPGGVPGEGSWGGATHTGGGAGDWTFPSDTRGDGSAATGQAIATEARTALDSFFTSATGFKLHQIDPADIPDIYGALYSSNFIDKYQHSIFNPLSACLSMHMIPEKLLDTQSATTKTDLTLSGYNITQNVTHKTYPQMPVIYSHHINKIFIDYTDTFLDYAPYTNAYLHLPYIGVLTLDINAIAHGELAIDYITDATNGNCAALVWCKDRDGHAQIKYVSQGNAAYTLPMFANAQDGSAVGKLISSGISLGVAGFMGDTAGQLRAAGGLLSGVFDAAAAKQNTQITGSFSGNVAMVSDSMCWLELVRPCWCEPEDYQTQKGIPSQLAGTMLDYGDGVPYIGFLRVQDIETDGITASAQEIAEIERLLRAGVFVDWQQDA